MRRQDAEGGRHAVNETTRMKLLYGQGPASGLNPASPWHFPALLSRFLRRDRHLLYGPGNRRSGSIPTVDIGSFLRSHAVGRAVFVQVRSGWLCRGFQPAFVFNSPRLVRSVFQVRSARIVFTVQ